MKPYRQSLPVLLLVLVILTSACTLPGGIGAPTPFAVDAIYTAAAQTLQAQLTQSAGQQPPVQTQEPAAGVVDTPVAPEVPSATPTPAFTDTPAFTPTFTFTPVPLFPMAAVDVNSNCRKGPSPAYDPPVSTLRKGEQAEVHGRNPDRTWWYVQIPAKPGQFCWVWGNNVTVGSDTGNVPIVEPPPLPPTITPSPTPDAEFDPSFDNVHTCSGDPYAVFELDNTGGVDFESMRLIIVDTDDDDEIYDNSSDAPFMGDDDECPPGGDTFPDGKTFFVAGNIEDGGSGHDAEAEIILCTKEDLKGTCISESVDFEIP